MGRNNADTGVSVVSSEVEDSKLKKEKDMPRKTRKVLLFW